jgi:ferredoxin-NADP reductase
VALPVDCLEGLCGTCKVRVLEGRVEPGFCSDDALSQEERAAGWTLSCQAKAQTDLVVLTPALAQQLRGKGAAAQTATVSAIEPVAKNTVVLRLRPEGGAPIDFLPGQYARLIVPGSAASRSYSYSNAPGAETLEFLIRLLPSGAMSDWLRRAAPGETLRLSGPFGVFFARPSPQPVVMIAGGTGLGPMLSMLRAEAGKNAPPVTLFYGVNEEAELACLDDLRALLAQRPGSSLHLSVVGGARAESGAKTGFVTDLLDALDAERRAAALFYLCGPPPMIEAARSRLLGLGVAEERLICERFSDSSEVALA